MYNSNLDIWIVSLLNTGLVYRYVTLVYSSKTLDTHLAYSYANLALQAGAFAAVTVDLIVYPFDTLKTRVQSPDYNRLYKDAATGAVRRSALYGGLYQGVWSVVLSTIPGCMLSRSSV
jgi:cytidylate kinase